ncbi:MAG: hypothetical protein ACLQQ4_15880 [Bacteroidia bacterium]
MKKFVHISILLILPLLVIAQDNVPVNNKKTKEKGGAMDNPEIKKSKKEMDKEGSKFHEKKYRKEVKPGHNKGDKEDKKEKKEEKKAL